MVRSELDFNRRLPAHPRGLLFRFAPETESVMSGPHIANACSRRPLVEHAAAAGRACCGRIEIETFVVLVMSVKAMPRDGFTQLGKCRSEVSSVLAAVLSWSRTRFS